MTLLLPSPLVVILCRTVTGWVATYDALTTMILFIIKRQRDKHPFNSRSPGEIRALINSPTTILWKWKSGELKNKSTFCFYCNATLLMRCEPSDFQIEISSGKPILEITFCHSFLPIIIIIILLGVESVQQSLIILRPTWIIQSMRIRIITWLLELHFITTSVWWSQSSACNWRWRCEWTLIESVHWWTRKLFTGGYWKSVFEDCGGAKRELITK